VMLFILFKARRKAAQMIQLNTAPETL
jgi:hypothetical protein